MNESNFPKTVSETCLNNENTPSWVKNSLKKLTVEGDYRVAEDTDFLFETVKINNEYTRMDIQRWIKCPLIMTDLNGDDKSDLGIILINKSSASKNKYNFLIVNNSSTNRANSDFNWLFKDDDLSTMYLDKWSEGVTLRKYKESGEFVPCHILWDKIKKSYICERQTKVKPQ